jgi:hypothetical protein
VFCKGWASQSITGCTDSRLWLVSFCDMVSSYRFNCKVMHTGLA